MKLSITGEHYNFEVVVNGNLALMELRGGWWQVTDGAGTNRVPPFRSTDTLRAIMRVVNELATMPAAL